MKEKINQALVFVKNKQYDEAEKLYLEVLKLTPDNVPILSLLGYLYLNMQEYEKAERVFALACRKSDEIPVIDGLLKALFALGKNGDAIPFLIKKIKIEFNIEDYILLSKIIAYNALSSCGTGSLGVPFIKYLEEAVEIYPLNEEIVLSYSIALLCLYRYDESLSYCQKVLSINPKNPRALSQLARIYTGKYCDLETSNEFLKKAIKYGSDDTKETDYLALAKNCHYMKNYAYSTRILNKILNPFAVNYNQILTDIGANYLAQRKFKKGYEYYLQNDGKKIKEYKLKNKWDGKPHKDETIYVMVDDCFGDNIQYLRYVPFLKDKFKRVKFAIQPMFHDLVAPNLEGIELVSEDLDLQEYDYHVLLSHLPYYLNMDFNHIPSTGGYLKYPKKEIKSDKLKVGLCWMAGHNPPNSPSHKQIELYEFKPLFEQDFEFYSFYKDATEDECKKWGLINLGKEFKTFTDTAAYIQAMDVVVTVDTAVAHLAGALGLRTLMFLPYYSEWRWFDNTEKTEWYDSIKILKQSQKHGWQPEIERVVEELKSIC